MRYILTGDQLRTKDRRVSEILRQFGQAEYPFEPEHALRMLEAIQKFGEGKFLELMGILKCPELEWAEQHLAEVRLARDNAALMALICDGKLPIKPSQIFAAHLIPTTDGKPWEVEEDVWPTVTDATVLRPVSVLRKGDGSYINTGTMCARAPEHHANLGLADAPRLLAQPEKLKAFHGFFIPLPGTKLRASNGDRYVAYLRQVDGGLWRVFFHRVGDDWDGNVRFASCE